ncbi:MAG: M3 family oligoendopeptidase [Nanoarchaeota archaeon]|nr:M3 family oligoendopeptidase [Nanoarchaeota archaeon]
MEKLNWDISHVIKDEKEFKKILNDLKKSFSRFDFYKNKLSPKMSSKEFIELIQFEEELGKKLSRLSTYLSLKSSLDTKSQEVMKLEPLLEDLQIKISDKERPISHWIQGLSEKNKLDDKNAKRLFSSLPQHEYNLNYSREKAKHTLSEEIESIIHKKDMFGIGVIPELYEKIITNFTFKFQNKKIDNVDEIKKYWFSTNKNERKESYLSFLNTYKEHKETIFTIYSAIIKDWKLEQELRKYETPINVRNINNHLDDKTINTLIKTCKKNINIYQEYFKLKAKYLKLKKLNRTDIYAPIKKKETKISLNESKEIVLKVFQDFHLEFYNKALKLFNESHIDSHPSKNKTSGAFCMSITPEITPYVLLNFTETKRDVSTVAHELGHAIHDLYTSDLPHSVSHAPIPLCETASTFCELLLFEYLLKESSKEEKRALLIEKISDSYATIIRQIYFTKFEMDAHNNIPKGFTEDDISQMYLDNLKEQFGDSLIIPDSFKYEWLYVSHFFYFPFYCYGYSFGDLLSMALYQQYKKEGKTFIPKFERILSAGGSVDPQVLLKKEGFDISKEKFWQAGFDLIKEWLEELKKLS